MLIPANFWDGQLSLFGSPESKVMYDVTERLNCLIFSLFGFPESKLTYDVTERLNCLIFSALCLNILQDEGKTWLENVQENLI